MFLARRIQCLIVLNLGMVLMFGIPTSSLANPITSISAVGISYNPSGGNLFTLDSFNSVGTNEGELAGASGSSLDYTLGATTVTGTNVTGTATLSSTFTLTYGSGTAVWDINNPATLHGANGSLGNFGSAGTVTTANLASNTTTLTLPTGTWGFSTSISNVNISAGPPASASFSSTVADTISLTAPVNPNVGVPEPSSLLLWSILGMVGLCFGCMKLRWKLAA